MNNTKVYGTAGEFKAKQFLQQKKYIVLAMNYRTKMGEIDLIMKDKDTIVFVEVKARNTLAFGYPRESVTPQKQRKIQQIAQLYLMKTKNINKPIRFDVVEILGDNITHIENAF